MKKSSLQTLALIISAALTMVACKKSDTPAPQQNNNADGEAMAAFMKNNGPAFETFTFNADAGAVITSSKGTTYTIRGGAFQTKAGASVTGNVTVSIKEINSPADMIFSNKPTLTRDGRLLASYGEFFVKAAQNNQGLQLKKDSAIKVAVKAKPNGQEIPMWSGDSTISTSISGYDYLNVAVTLNVQMSVNKGIVWDQQTTAGYALFNGSNGTLNFSIDSLVQWKNCDQIISNPSDPKTTVLGYFASHYNAQTQQSYMGDQPTILFFKPHNQNSLIRLYDVILNAPAGYEGFYSYQQSMPIGMQGTFLAISTVNGKFYADMKDVTIPAPSGSNNYTTFTFDPQEVSESTMVSLITSLNTK
ncbi:MAG TPA: hypothetical protein VGM31_03595 [Puia sp.]